MFWIISTSCMRLLLSGTGDPKVTDWDIKGKGQQLEDYMYSTCVNALFRCSIKRNTLIAICYLIGPAETGWQDKKDAVQVLIASTFC